jgi:hypothetical protein
MAKLANSICIITHRIDDVCHRDKHKIEFALSNLSVMFCYSPLTSLIRCFSVDVTKEMRQFVTKHAVYRRLAVIFSDGPRVWHALSSRVKCDDPLTSRDLCEK